MRHLLLICLLLPALCYTGVGSYAQSGSSMPDSINNVVAEDYASSQEEKHIYDTSDQFFNTRYEGEQFTYDPVTTHASSHAKVEVLKKDEAFWYVNDVEDFTAYVDSIIKHGKKTDRLPPADEVFARRSGTSGIFGNALFWVAVAIFLSALLYFMLSNKIGFFAPRAIADPDGIAIEDMGENLFALKYDDLLAKALKEQNYRLAVRVLYLKTLRQLSDKGMITYQPDYTNIDYLIQLRTADRYEDFARITRHYEYVWYGKFEVSKELYDRIGQDFITVQHKIG